MILQTLRIVLPPPLRGRVGGGGYSTGIVRLEHPHPRPLPARGRGAVSLDRILMRVVGGRLKGRNLASPSSRDIRPTADRLRESLFNILDSRL